MSRLVRDRLTVRANRFKLLLLLVRDLHVRLRHDRLKRSVLDGQRCRHRLVRFQEGLLQARSGVVRRRRVGRCSDRRDSGSSVVLLHFRQHRLIVFLIVRVESDGSEWRVASVIRLRFFLFFALVLGFLFIFRSTVRLVCGVGVETRSGRLRRKQGRARRRRCNSHLFAVRLARRIAGLSRCSRVRAEGVEFNRYVGRGRWNEKGS